MGYHAKKEANKKAFDMNVENAIIQIEKGFKLIFNFNNVCINHDDIESTFKYDIPSIMIDDNHSDERKPIIIDQYKESLTWFIKKYHVKNIVFLSSKLKKNELYNHCKGLINNILPIPTEYGLLSML